MIKDCHSYGRVKGCSSVRGITESIAYFFLVLSIHLKQAKYGSGFAFHYGDGTISPAR
ncbi:hypothetical protein SAMN05216404_12413 [Nitrosospira multiformis]|uniref:Uncharacterized protein n=1 Tax=Nitrosospira multiformis TaxID=1231 RepID=A0A1H8PYI2_9PROT|nr:hypothetical protein SAMN05216404_12413 [Nitrosospira multiformis]